MSRHFTADAYQRLIEDSDVQNTQLYPCKHAIVEDLQTGRPVFLVKRGIPRHDSKAKAGMVEMVPSFPAGSFVDAFRWGEGMHWCDGRLHDVGDISKCRRSEACSLPMKDFSRVLVARLTSFFPA